MRKLTMSNRYLRDRSKCQKKGWKVAKLDAIVKIMEERQFTPEECKRWAVHSLIGRWQGYDELHVEGIARDWVLIYTKDGNEITLEFTGKHNDYFKGSTEISDLTVV